MCARVSSHQTVAMIHHQVDEDGGDDYYYVNDDDDCYNNRKSHPKWTEICLIDKLKKRNPVKLGMYFRWSGT